MSKELNKALDLLREIRPSIPKDVLELWCKDRDAFLAQRSEFHQHLKECADEVATWPTYKREALGPFLGHELGIEGETETANELNKAPVEQAGGDERAAFFKHLIGRHPAHETEIVRVVEHNHAAWKAWQARAALAQPFPESDLDPFNLAPHAEAFNEAPAEALKPGQAEAERPVVIARLYRSNDLTMTPFAEVQKPLPMPRSDGTLTVEPLMTVAQHERIVGALRAEIAEWQEAAGRGRSDVVAYIAERAKLLEGRDAALARVAELEKQEPVAYVLFRDGEVYYETDDNIVISNTPGDETDLYRWLPVFTAPAAQAQQLHDLDKQCRDDVARALGLRPSQERGFAWSYLLASINSCVKASEDAAQAQHSAPEVSGIGRDTGHPRAVVLYLRKEPTDDDLRAIHDALRSLAAAPGKEVPQAWLDVQAERRRQITAEGWTPEHDDLYCAAELPRAAAAYILNGANDEAPAIWPFSAKWWKPRDARANYVRAAALILAEIERLDRAAPGKDVGHE